MDLKAFQQLYTEAEDAIAERRLFDVLALTEAILKDTSFTQAIDETTDLRADYNDFLAERSSLPQENIEEMVNVHFRNAIDILQMARDFWSRTHAETPYGRMQKATWDMEADDILPQLKTLSEKPFGTDEYFKALDIVFVMFWTILPEPYAMPSLKIALQGADSFTRRTLVGALFLGTLERFSTERLALLLALAKPQKRDSETDRADIRARVAVALTATYRRYQPFFLFHTDEAALLHDFFSQSDIREQLPTLLHAFTAQELVERVGNRVDDILPIIREAFEKQQPNLGTNDDEETDNTEKPQEGMKIKTIHIDVHEGDRLFNQLANHARTMDEMRQADLDINYSSFAHMKHFHFFHTDAHWFYPFTTAVPDIQAGITRKNGKPDHMALNIMVSNRFCASDCYSYACMNAHLRQQRDNSFMDLIQEQWEEMEKSMNEFGEEMPHEQPPVLNPFADYLQSLYRFFLRPDLKDLLYHVFQPDNLEPLAALPLFSDLITSENDLKPSINTFLYLGAHKKAVVLAQTAIERFGADAELLRAQGTALMQMQQWKRALSAFQQLLLIREDADAELAMARCFEALAQWNDALPLLLKAEQRLGDAADAAAANLIEETGRCLIQLQRWDEAVERFFRLEFMERHLNVARRAIAWCSIQQGKYERAATYYRQLIDRQKATWEDRLNLGHALWLQGLASEAVAAYRESQAEFNRAAQKQRRHFRHWTEAFQEDARSLLAAHFSDTECALMLDAITAQ